MYSIFSCQLFIKHKHGGVVPLFTITCIENLKLKHDISETETKGWKLRLCFQVFYDVPEKKGIDFGKQMSPSKCSSTSIWGIFLPFIETLPQLQFMLDLHFTPACLLLSVCSLHFTFSLYLILGPHFAVRGPQSAFYTDRFQYPYT